MIINQKRLLIRIVVIAAVLFFVFTNISRLTPESNNYKTYAKALKQYNNNAFSDAYYNFGKVSRFSKLKSAALFRQALCADKLGDDKIEIKKYKEVISKYPDSALAIRAKYLEAQKLYNDQKYKKAKKEFKNILNKYPQTDYAIAAKYYLGAIEVDRSINAKSPKRKYKAQKKAILYFKAYLKDAPNGRFAINCIKKWESLNTKLNNEDNLLIAKIYQENQDYKDAQKYLKFTNISVSWPYLVQNAYNTKDLSKVKYYTEEGLKGKGSDEVLINETEDEKSQDENIYKAVDLYLKISNDPKTSLSYLLSISQGSRGYDYLFYKSCNNLSSENKIACYNTLYKNYPDGHFAADALANIFYDKIRLQKYFMAKKIGKRHLAQYRNSNSAPKVMFWLGKVAERTKNYEEARGYYKSVIRQYPDDYYAYRSFLCLNRLRRFSITDLEEKPIEFPYKSANYGIITELAKVKDYGLLNQLYKDNDFIQSWLEYLQGNYSTSARIARDAMEKLPQKPNKDDPRWRLVYPLHYYNEISEISRVWGNDPIVILSIIREESYFNPKAQSRVGACGLMQLMPLTALEAGNIAGISIPNKNLLFDPDINIRLGNVYFSKLKKLLMGKDILAVLAYNGGIGSVSNWKDNLNYYDVDDFIEQVPYPETQNYLKKVYKSYWNYLRIYSYIRF